MTDSRIRITAETTDAQTNIAALTKEVGRLTNAMQDLADKGDFSEAVNNIRSFEETQKALQEARGNTQGISGESGGFSSFSNGSGTGGFNVPGAVSGIGNLAVSATDGNVFGTATGLLSMLGKGGALGGVLGAAAPWVAGIGAALGAAVLYVNHRAKRFDSIKEQAEDLRRNFGQDLGSSDVKENAEYTVRNWESALGYAQGYMPGKEFAALMSEGGRYGIKNGDKAGQWAQSVARASNFLGIDSDSLASFSGLIERFNGEGEGTIALNRFVQGGNYQGLTKKQLEELLPGVQNILTSSINNGYKRSIEDIMKDLSALYRASGFSEFWKGEQGVSRYQRLEDGTKSAVNLSSTEDVLIFKAASDIADEMSDEQFEERFGMDKTNSYLDAQMIIESGEFTNDIVRSFIQNSQNVQDETAVIEALKNRFGFSVIDARTALKAFKGDAETINLDTKKGIEEFKTMSYAEISEENAKSQLQAEGDLDAAEIKEKANSLIYGKNPEDNLFFNYGLAKSTQNTNSTDLNFENLETEKMTQPSEQELANAVKQGVKEGIVESLKNETLTLNFAL